MILFGFLWACTEIIKKPEFPTSVIVIGGGPAGLATATRINNQYGVLVLEAEKELGGKQRYTQKPEFLFVGSSTQKQNGITDDIAAVRSDWRLLSGIESNDIVEDFLNHNIEIHDWLIQNGIEFEAPIPHKFGHVPRQHLVKDNSFLPLFLSKATKSPNITIQKNTHVQDILIENSEIKGVQLDDGTYVYASVVVIASGGFTNNPAILSDVLQSNSTTPTHWVPSQYQTGQGEALLWSQKYDFVTENTDKIGYMCNGIATSNDPLFFPNAKPPLIFVNSNGTRFVNEEDLGRSHVFRKLLRMKEYEESFVAIAPLHALSQQISDIQKFQDAQKSGNIYCSDRYSDISNHTKMPLSSLQQSIQNIRQGKKDSLGRSEFPLFEGQICTFDIVCSAQKTYGGLHLDPSSRQVLKLNKEPIQGLYAVGAAHDLQMGIFDGSLSAFIWTSWKTADQINRILELK